MSQSSGALIGNRYRLVRLIGEGQTSQVYRAVDQQTGREIALKLLRDEAADATALRRLEREARVAELARSRALVTVHDANIAAGRAYLALELLEGESLRTRLDRLRSMSAEDLFPVVGEILDGLAAAHDLGVLHRDLKPDHVFFARDASGSEHIKLLDFGLCKRTIDQSASLTGSGLLLGTPSYIAPETIVGGTIDRRADIYAVGVMMFEALAGRRPFVEKKLPMLIDAIVNRDPPRLGTIAPATDPRAEEIVARAIARSPEGRYRSARQLQGDVVAWLRTRRSSL